jgi:hypothetical protein
VDRSTGLSSIGIHGHTHPAQADNGWIGAADAAWIRSINETFSK